MSNETNRTALEIIDGFDSHFNDAIDAMIIPIYKQFPILGESIFGVTIGSMLLAFVVLSAFFMLEKVFTRGFTRLLNKVAKRTENKIDDQVIVALKGPIGFLFIIIGLHMFFIIIGQESQFTKRVLDSMLVYDIFWAILSIMDASRGLFDFASSKFNTELAQEMGDFMLKIIKVLIIGVGFGTILKVWGVDVTALIASLGLGGLAFALAAKDTASNLFGSFALLADKSIRRGEWIRVGEIEGIVEDIGMRTTKIRSFEKSLITVPNQILANTPIENYSRRGIRRININIGVTYETTQEQLSNIVESTEGMLRSHTNIAQDELLIVNFESFGDSSLNIFVYCFAKSSEWEEYLNIRQDIHLQIMKIVQDNGSDFAFPSRTLYMQGSELLQKP